MNVEYCRRCGHARQLHCPGGVLAATKERGHGPRTCGSVNRPCRCTNYTESRYG